MFFCFVFLLLLLDKSGCYVLVSVLLFWVSLVFYVVCVFFCLFLVCFVFMEGLRVK